MPQVIYVGKNGLGPTAGMAWVMQWVIPEPNSGCWLWGGSLNQGGYASISTPDGTRNAHRVAWELHYDRQLSSEIDLDHKCRTRCCVNPEHLEPVTRAENLRRGARGWNSQPQSHCRRGHPMTPENTYYHSRGWGRMCVRCQRERVRKWRAKQKELTNG